MGISRIAFVKTKAFKMGAAALCVAAIAGGVAAGALHASPAEAALTVTYKPWSFGIISDTQWTVGADDGYNPNTVAANQIRQIDKQFVKAGVKLVVAVGDTVDKGDKNNIDTRALYAQDLYNAGIGFYPLRGNHEATEGDTSSYLTSGAEFAYAYPQIGTGWNNTTPAAITTSLIPAADLSNNAPAKKMGKTFMVGTNWSAPASNTTNKALSYSFRYNNATFVLLDQFDNAATDPNVYYNSTIGQQQSWIDGVLSSRPAGTQAFVFSHKNLLGGNHKDNLFGFPVGTPGTPAGSLDDALNPAAGKDPGDGSGMDLTKLTATQTSNLNAKTSMENAFLASMQKYNVPFVISGHDHQDYESVVTSQDGKSKVHELICASDSSKFYTPTVPVSANDAPVQQDLYKVGYYIVTVDGPCVTIDYYADPTDDSDYGLNGATFSFEKVASTSYSLNGTENLVAQGASYAMTDDTTKAATMGTGFLGTTMSILSGKNGSTAYAQYFATGTPGSLTALTKKMTNDVNTCWEPAEPRLASDILDLSGMSRSLGSTKTDEYVLSMSYHQTPASGFNTKGTFGLLARNANGQWVKAVGQNLGISQKFVVGAWNSSYTLGAYGVDPATHTAWAVLNYNGEFAVGQSGK